MPKRPVPMELSQRARHYQLQSKELQEQVARVQRGIEVSSQAVRASTAQLQSLKNTGEAAACQRDDDCTELSLRSEHEKRLESAVQHAKQQAASQISEETRRLAQLQDEDSGDIATDKATLLQLEEKEASQKRNILKMQALAEESTEVLASAQIVVPSLETISHRLRCHAGCRSGGQGSCEAKGGTGARKARDGIFGEWIQRTAGEGAVAPAVALWFVRRPVYATPPPSSVHPSCCSCGEHACTWHCARRPKWSV
jgi:hypothetical protein